MLKHTTRPPSLPPSHTHTQTKLGTSENILSAGMINIVKKADRKLTFIPIMFVLLRMWGTLQFFYSLIVSSSIVCSCTTSGIAIGFQILSGLQVSFVHTLPCTMSCRTVHYSSSTLLLLLRYFILSVGVRVKVNMGWGQSVPS